MAKHQIYYWIIGFYDVELSMRRSIPLSENMYGNIQLRWLLYKQLAQNEKNVRNVKYIDTERFVDNHSLIFLLLFPWYFL